MKYAYDFELAPTIPHVPQMASGGVAEARSLIAERAANSLPFKLPRGIIQESVAIPVDANESFVTVHSIRPTSVEPGSAAVLWFHGGGFILGSALMDLRGLSELAEELNAPVFSIEYSLAPEAEYPAAVNEGYAALRWLSANAPNLGLDASRIVVAGVSAGACLAAAVTLMARDLGGPPIRFQALDIPVVDDRLETESMITLTDTPLWSRVAASYSWRAYLGELSGADTPPYAAPARAGDLTNLPPTYVSVCEFDPLRDEGIDYAQRLVRAGVSTELHLFPGTFHGSAGSVPDAGISRRMRKEFAAAIRRGVN